MITIDGFDISTKWTLEPLYDNVNKYLMTAPSIKDRITENFEDVDGLSVLNSTAKVKEMSYTMSFLCDSFAKYNEFILYLLSHNPVNLYFSKTGLTYKLEYLSCSSFDDKVGLFSISVRENNPKDRTFLNC